MDFGVRRDGYCSEHQRVWYLRRPGESGPPAEVRRAFDTVLRAIQAGFDALRPGVEGWRVDAAARDVVRAAGYPEFMHALGHQVGRTVHDGAALLGPRWARYGDTPRTPVEVGSVFTLELGVRTEAGLISLEEMVVLGPDGARWLSPPQTKLILAG